MSHTFNPDWKRSYWPEPRYGKRETRSACCARLRAGRKAQQDARKAERLAAALLED